MIIHAPLWLAVALLAAAACGFLAIGLEIIDAKHRILKLENDLHAMKRGW